MLTAPSSRPSGLARLQGRKGEVHLQPACSGPRPKRFRLVGVPRRASAQGEDLAIHGEPEYQQLGPQPQASALEDKLLTHLNRRPVRGWRPDELGVGNTVRRLSQGFRRGDRNPN